MGDTNGCSIWHLMMQRAMPAEWEVDGGGGREPVPGKSPSKDGAVGMSPSQEIRSASDEQR